MYLTNQKLDALLFLLYFLRLRMNIILGQYYTANPVDIRWRWRYWHRQREIQLRRGSSNLPIG